MRIGLTVIDGSGDEASPFRPTADEAVASMPEQYFPVAVVAVKEALS